MDLMERLEWLTLGCVIGFILGYIVGRLRDIKDEVHDIKKGLGTMEGEVKRMRDERGVMTHRWSANIALFIVVSLTLYSAFMSQVASNKSNDTAEKIISLQLAQEQNQNCTTQILFDTVSALNERTTYTRSQADANIALVQAQYDLITKGQNPNLTQEEQTEIFNVYVNQVRIFLELAEQTKNQQSNNPFPTVEDLARCLTQGAEDAVEE